MNIKSANESNLSPGVGIASDSPGFLNSETPRSRARSRTISQVAFPFRSNAASDAQHEPSRFNILTDTTTRIDRALQETRKLLSHILNELKNRPRPSPVWLTGVNPSTTRTKRGSNRRHGEAKASALALTAFDSDSSEESTPSGFSPGTTFDLLNKLRDVLQLAKAKGWRLFDDSADGSDPLSGSTAKQPTFKFRRSSFNSSGRRTRSVSPNRSNKSAPSLLSQCLALLHSVITEDCRHHFRSLKLDRPPNALQALTLNIAQMLAFLYRENGRVLHELCLAILPAFYSFPESMHGLLIAFFDGSILRSMLQEFGDMDVANPRAKGSPTDSAQDVDDVPIVAIQVDEANDENANVSPSTHGWQHWSPLHQPPEVIPSSFAPCRSIECYQACSATSSLLAALLDTVDVWSEDPVLSHRLYNFMVFLTHNKYDFPLNLLDIVAHHSSRARHRAIGLLSMFWPRAFGHLCIGKPFPLIHYAEKRIYGQGSMQHQHSHQFVPWLFSTLSNLPEECCHQDCQSCFKPIDDAGLMCPLCLCTIHMNCYDYPDGTHLIHYPVSTGAHTRKVAVHRFSYLKPSTNLLEQIRKGQHTFGPVNILTLSLCSICLLPLWGYIEQGLRCKSCHKYAHATCLDAASLPQCLSEEDEKYISIKWIDFTKSFLENYRSILLAENDLQRCSQEEIFVYWSVLTLQLRLFEAGIASGSIGIIQDHPRSSIGEFELHHFLKKYTAFLGSEYFLGDSTRLADTTGRELSAQNRDVLFDWTMLTYITSCLKSPQMQDLDEVNQGLLSVHLSSSAGDIGSESYTSEVITLAQFRDQLGTQFGFKLQESACIMIRHLHHLGLVTCDNLPEDSMSMLQSSADIRCKFGLPLGIDLSSDVELLISAIEACLEEINVAVNEVGFLLLVRRFWPSEMLSDYAFSRLLMSVISWVLAEDDNLIIILRQYVGRQQDPPGVPSVIESRIWPSYLPTRNSSTGSFASSSDYLTCRKTLLHKYASRWLSDFHQKDPRLYSSLLFSTINELSRKSAARIESYDSEDAEVEAAMDSSKEFLLRSILKLCQASIAFSAADDLLRTWLEVMTVDSEQQTGLAGLPRLFNREMDGSNRWTIAPDATITSFETSESSLKDPWRIVINVASSGSNNLQKALGWLRLFASSGVDIPTSMFQQLLTLIDDFSSPFNDVIILTESVFKAVWLKSIGRLELHTLISSLYDRCENLNGKQFAKNELSQFVRLTLSTLLLLYGCERTRLQEYKLVLDKDIEGLISRRRVARAGSIAADDIFVDDSALVKKLAQYAETKNEQVLLLIAKYLTMLLTETSYLSAEEVNDFIKRDGSYLIRIAWMLYDIRDASVNNMRALLLSRLLSVDVKLLTELISLENGRGTALSLEIDTASRLFQIVLDTNRSTLWSIDKQDVRATLIPIFYQYFKLMWTSAREEIRMATQTWASTLQPAHLRVISTFFSDALIQFSITEKLELISFLVQLKPYFPTWKILSWESIVETLMDDEYLQKGNMSESAISAHLSMYGILSTTTSDGTEPRTLDAGALQSSLLVLSLQMIAEGAPIDVFSLLKIKLQLAILLGFSSASLIPAANGQSFYVNHGDLVNINPASSSCFSIMMTLLDSRKLFELPASAMTVAVAIEDDTPSQVLVGSAFLDIFFNVLICAVESRADISNQGLKTLLQSASIAMYKHDIDSSPLRHLRDLMRRAVKALSDILVEDVGHELKQLAFTGILAFRNRWLTSTSNRDMWIHIATNVLKFLSNRDIYSDDATHAQGITLLQDIFSRHHAIFFNIGKRKLSEETFTVLRLALTKGPRNSGLTLPLGELVFKDTIQAFAYVNTCSNVELNTVFDNVRRYVEAVYRQGYSAETLTLTGEGFAAVLRYAGDWAEPAFDSSSLFVAAASLLQYNKNTSRGLLQHMESALRLALLHCDISKEALLKLFQITSTLYRRLAFDTTGNNPNRNPLHGITLECLSEFFRGKSHMMALTVEATVEWVCSDEQSYITKDIIHKVAQDAFLFIQSWAPTSDLHTLQASKAACYLVLHATQSDIGFLSRQMNDYEQKNGKQSTAVRMWNILLLEALQRPALGDVWAQLFAQLSSFSAAYYTSLQASHCHFSSFQDILAFDINQAYIAIKLWILLSLRVSDKEIVQKERGSSSESDYQFSEDRNASLVWNELWPAFESLILLSDPDAEMSDITPISSLVWSSVADILLFLRVSRCSLSLESSAHIAILDRMRELGRGDSHARKLVRTANSIVEVPAQVPQDGLITQIDQELRAAEKLLQALAMGFNRSLPERSRRDLRLAIG